METIEAFRRAARRWLDDNAERRPQAASDADRVWGEGSDSVALFHNFTFEEERAHIAAHRSWIQRKADAGFANIGWEPEFGGRGLPRPYEQAFAAEESHYVVPPSHESIAITTLLIAPTIRAIGTNEQKQRFIAPALRTDELWCELFSEPGAGSDLAAVTTKAERDGDGWRINGQKVWTSGAQFADWGYVICRTDIDSPKHRGITAFLVPMSSPGLEVRPLRQMTGGSSFNEVFFTDVLVPEWLRLGDVGAGWQAALTTLGFERNFAGGGARRGGISGRLIDLAQHQRTNHDPVIRQLLARAYSHQRLLELTGDRVKVRQRGGDAPGPEGSIGKLFWTEGLRLTNQITSTLLGPRLVADTDEWGTYAWSEHLLGTAGYRIAAGTDEIQRNIIAERVLGLPADVRVDRDRPFRDLPR